ncbi:hypothetical protein [Vibrio splendidus]|uniref:hypothetical protein n=1 Tax=Vibrio splendidus TaxID=29497 RepID=UPI003D0A6D89
MNARKLNIESVEQFNLCITALEKLLRSRKHFKNVDELKIRTAKINLLTNSINAFKCNHDLKYAIFKEAQLVGIKKANSAMGGVRKLESATRNQLNLDFTVCRTSIDNDNLEYSVALLAHEVDFSTSLGKLQNDIPIFSSTLEHFYVQDRQRVYDLCAQSLPTVCSA